MDLFETSPRELINRQIKQCLETGNRQELASILDDEVVIKRLEAGRYAEVAKRLMCFATHSMVIGLGATRCCSE